MKQRAASNLIGLLLSSLAWTGCSSPEGPSPAPPPAATRDGRFIQDIEALAKDLPRLHPNLFFKTSRELFEREVEGLKTRVAEMGDTEVVTGLVRLAAIPGDAHTAIYPFTYTGFRRLPIRVRFLSDGLVVTSAAAGGEALLGGRIVQIGDLDVGEAVEKLAPVISRANEAWLRAFSPNYLIIPEILHAQRIVADPERVRMAVLKPDGALAQADLPGVVPGREGTFADASTAPLPLYRQRSQENYWYTWAEGDVVYIQYNRCQNAAADPMSSFAKRVFDDIDRRVPKAVIVDLRGNGGGDSSVLDPLIQGLRSRSFLAQSGRLFAFIGNATFSSALMNAISLKRELGAVLVGEPTGGKPNGYGETRSFNLPNSGLPVTYSTKFFRSWPDGDPESLFPDVGAAISSTDYREGRDPAMDTVAARLGLPTAPNAR